MAISKNNFRANAENTLQVHKNVFVALLQLYKYGTVHELLCFLILKHEFTLNLKILDQ